MIKLKIAHYLLLLLLPSFLIAQTTDDKIKNIRSWYKDVEENLTRCTVIELTDWVDEQEYFGYNPVFKGYYNAENKQFIKIEEKGMADWHEVTKMYYLKGGVLFFVFIKGYNADEMYTAEELGISETEFWQRGGEAKNLKAYEERIYLAENKTIRYLKKEKIFSTGEQNFDMSDLNNENRNTNEIDTQRIISYVNRILNAIVN